MTLSLSSDSTATSDDKNNDTGSLSLPHHVLPPIPIGHPDKMMSVESVRRAVEEFQTKPTDVIVATFAKTGTTLVTWLCHLIRLYHANGALLDLEQHLASLETLYQVVPWPLLSWDIGYDPNTVDGSQYQPRIFKSHLRMASIYRGPGVKYIVTIRNPAKTALSFYNFFLAKQVPLVQHMDASQFLVETPLIRGKPGERASLWEYYREYHVLRDCPAVLMLVYEDIVHDMPRAIRQISNFIHCPLPDDPTIQTVASKSTKEFMAQHMSLFDEPYERAKRLNRAGDISQLAPGAKIALQQHSQKLNERARSFLATQWNETMAPLGYDSYEDFTAMVRARNDQLFSDK